jgi:hypothetical protein
MPGATLFATVADDSLSGTHGHCWGTNLGNKLSETQEHSGAETSTNTGHIA